MAWLSCVRGGGMPCAADGESAMSGEKSRPICRAGAHFHRDRRMKCCAPAGDLSFFGMARRDGSIAWRRDRGMKRKSARNRGTFLVSAWRRHRPSIIAARKHMLVASIISVARGLYTAWLKLELPPASKALRWPGRTSRRGAALARLYMVIA